MFECGSCGMKFEKKVHLVRHVAQHNTIDPERPFPCVICNQRFRQMSTLLQHSAIHSNDRPFACDVCHKAFNRASTLISHKKTHSEIKPYVCHICQRGFFQKGNLKNHLFSHTNERPYKCDFCDRGFNQMSNLVCHRRKIHATKLADIDVQRCKTCAKTFARKQELREHERSAHPTSMKKAKQQATAKPLGDRAELYLTDIIRTKAMETVVSRNETPFAIVDFLLKKNVVMRVYSHSQGTYMRAVSKDDLDANIENRGMPVVAHVTEVLNFNDSSTSYLISPPKTSTDAVMVKGESAEVSEIDFNNINFSVDVKVDSVEEPESNNYMQIDDFDVMPVGVFFEIDNGDMEDNAATLEH